MKRVILLGATGSIGDSSIDIISNFKEDFKLVGISAHSNDKRISQIGREFNVKNIALSGKSSSSFDNINYFNSDGLLEMIRDTEADIVINGIAGSSGLLPSIESIKSGKDLALANKETLVMAGKIIQDLVKKHDKRLIPVDSEHSAIFHLLENEDLKNIKEVIITASGGAFRDLSYKELKSVTVEDALKHPTWSMGTKITIDSASMANKGLEVIEAARLFNLPGEKINVVIHPQSYVHSMIRKNDNSIYAQISTPDMRLPIQNALFYPELKEVNSAYLDIFNKRFDFIKPDPQKYKMLFLAFQALKKGEAYTIAYNAVNEVVVDLFINGDINFLDIPLLTEKVIDMDLGSQPETIEEIIELDRKVREITLDIYRKNNY